MTTDRARFKVKEGTDGDVFLALEPLSGELSLIGRGHLGLELLRGTTHEQAAALADELNAAVSSLVYWATS